MTDKKHIDTYDWIRVIAIILVVIGHSSYLSISTILGGVDYELPVTRNGHYFDIVCTTIRDIGTWAYQFHMPLFFMLSGAVTAIAKLDTFDKMFEKKVKRLIVPYYVYGLLFMLPVKYLADFYTKGSIREAARSFLEISECGHLWFFPALFWCFVFSYILIKTIGQKSDFLMFIIVFIIWKCIPDISNGYYGIILSLDYLPWFIIGYIYEKKRGLGTKEFNLKLSIGKLILLTFIVWATSGVFFQPDDFITVLIKAYWIYCISEICVNTLGKNSVIKSTIRTISVYSIYIYVFHDPLEYVILKIAFAYDWLSSGYGVYLYYFSRTVLVFGVSFLLGILVTKAKSIVSKRVTVESR